MMAELRGRDFERNCIAAAVAGCTLSAGIIARMAAAGEMDRAKRPAHEPRVAALGAPDWSGSPSGPLCGVYAACTALELIGISAAPRDFIATKYIGRCGGSSPIEVARIVE